MRTYKEKIPNLTYAHTPCGDCQRNVDAAFDIRFEAVLKRRKVPVENRTIEDRSES